MNVTRLQLYSPYQRIWHWLQAAGILLLVLSGLCLHNPGWCGPIDFATVVLIHNFLGFLLIANAFLGLFYHATTGAIRQYLPEPHDFVSLSVRQARYYLRGMFRGEPHPLQKTPDRRLNPLQQVTYLMILNVLLPLQIVTGVLMWGGQRWPELIGAIGGLRTLGMVHTFGAWMLVAFTVAHLYLTTTGHTPLANIKAMILGYEDIPAPDVDTRPDADPRPNADPHSAVVAVIEHSPEPVRTEA